ncbi:MAG: CapA family protein [Bacteroides sp.]|nr:CapA family protein [Bacteroides sp.]MCM1379824.1 CapA family protein [Bacteroides sp.]MCM1446183.1 CapA family protein [Prevotella sp.]
MTLLADLLAYILPLLPQMEAQPQAAELIFAGDAMMHEAQISASRTPDGHDFSGYFDSIRTCIESADFAVVNFEAPLGDKPYRGYPCFSAPDEYPRALTDAGFDFFLLANNHILDRRDRGLHRTISRLDSLGIPHCGIYHNAAHRDSLCPHIVDINGFKVGILNYTYGTNGITIQHDALVNYIDTAAIARDICQARTAGAELIAACLHWGEEYRLLPNAQQKRLADWLCTKDVDMIIGGHPHVIQPMEMRRHNGRNTLVVYSLGNFISNMKTADTRGGAMVRIRLERDSRGKAGVASAEYSLVFTEPPTPTRPNFRLMPAEKSKDYRAAAFIKNAEAIFSKHNINVPRKCIE